MQSLKNIVINGAIILALLFGLTVSATATPSSDFEATKASAERGNPITQAGLGSMYSLGYGVKQNYEKAFYWHKKAAEQGNAGGQAGLAVHYYEGTGVSQDYSKAFYWYKKAADQNNEFAQSQVGAMYKYGLGVRQNKTTAKEWYGKSCDNGYQGGCDYYKELNEQGY